MRSLLHGDIRENWTKIPGHFDVLCAGFPCQPFSKSGEQLGTKDETRGTLFHEIIKILREWEPSYVILENVGNFERHDRGNTWRVVKSKLEGLGYAVRGTTHVTPLPEHDWRDRSHSRARRNAAAPTMKGIGLVSPHHFGHPHHRERFFIVAYKGRLPENPFPNKQAVITNLQTIVHSALDMDARDRAETQPTIQQVRCIDHWGSLVRELPTLIELPTFPLWGDELDAMYPFEHKSPWSTPPIELGRLIPGKTFAPYTRRDEILAHLPSYAREEVDEFREWKKQYIRANRKWWAHAKPHLPRGWSTTLQEFPPSLRKLEWNAKGGERDIWKYVLQFRPSGLRVKRYTSCPALVAMTATQIPLLGPERRFLTRTEGLRLQGLPDDFHLPDSRAAAFKALGNGVHVDVVRRIAAALFAAAGKGAEPVAPVPRLH